MAQAGNTDVVDDFEEFYRTYYRDEIGELARRYPSDQRSLYVSWQDLYRHDAALAEDVRQQPDQFREYAEEALRLYDLPVDVSLGQAHVRIEELPDTVGIREIRARHRGQLVAVQGIVRKATDVRPKVQEAAFECQRCGTLTRIPQTGGEFQEPHECQGCERQGPFRINYDQSEFVDAQKLRIQESPEGLRGGETPQSIDVHIEDDVTGEVTAGDHVRVTGVLHLDQQESGQRKSSVFDVFMEGWAVEVEDEQFEDMAISEADKKDIVELSNDPDIYDRMIDSMAPSIHGYEQEKLAIILQLFSGVTKNLPDESRVRGDLHILLIGDPGTGKCVEGDTEIVLSDGCRSSARELVEENLDEPKPVDDGVWDTADFEVPSLRADGTIGPARVSRVWKRRAPERLYRLRTAAGREIEVTPSHPLFVVDEGSISPKRAAELSEGRFIAVSRRVPSAGTDVLDIGYRRSQANDAAGSDLPDRWTPSLARLVGYVVAEGYATPNEDGSGSVAVTDEDQEVLDDVVEALEKLGSSYAERDARRGNSARSVVRTAGEFVSVLEDLDPALVDPSTQQRVPRAIARASPRIKRAFLRAYIEGEAHVADDDREITVASASRELLEGVRSLLLSFGIQASVHPRENGSYRLRIGGADFERYVGAIGFGFEFVTERTSAATGTFDAAGSDTDTDVIPNVGDELHRIREALALTQHDCGVARTTYQHYERGDRDPSRESLETVIETFERRLDWLRLTRERLADGDWSDIGAVRDELGLSQATPTEATEVGQGAISYYERESVTPDGGVVADVRERTLDRIDEALAVAGDIATLRTLVGGDLGWDRIEAVEAVDPDDEWVYDLEVEGTHTYISNGVVSHNSQLLQYVRKISPRSVYTSGKGSSSAGLTAAAVQDDFGEGQQWTLEAGALVLADQGIAAVDELDKMAPEDRSAMHEALEQQTISISKAGINATLKSRCSLLGAANPKYGRFDEYEAIAEQIDLEPALISRFDVIFTVTDEPDPDEDRALAEHIIGTNYAGELNAHRVENATPDVSEEEVRDVTEDVEPSITPELLRKYVAYAKRSCFPIMTEGAKERIEEFYVDLREQGTGGDAPIPVTARKLEALVRLAEASARVRLSDTVEEADADRVIEVVRASMKDIGMDPETGEFDADIVETGTSKSQRDRIRNIKAIIQEVEGEHDDGAPIEEVLERAESTGMDRSKAEGEIEKLRRQGDVYEPRTDHLRTV